MDSHSADSQTRDVGTFPPPATLAQDANETASTYAAAAVDVEAFWAERARRLSWARPFSEVLDWSDPPFARWFADGELNVAYNCVDRHVEAGSGDRVALYFVGEPGDTRAITYAQLQDMVCRAANALIRLGVCAGDRVAIYLPMIPEAVVAMLACARLGAVHTVVFGGFSADALRGRINDCGARVVITADGGYRRGSASPLKPAVDDAVRHCPSVEHILVVRRTGGRVDWNAHRDVWWHDVVDTQSPVHEPEAFGAEQPLFIMYTSGTTGTPKGILHTSAGYLTQTGYTFWAIFDHKPDTDVYWCTADVGWITGHSYIVYGPLVNGATQVLYEGTPDAPNRGRWWEIVERYKVTVLYTAPTAIRTFMKWGDAIPSEFDLSSLRILGSVGEAINPETYLWYRNTIGSGGVPIVDTWWQTETGAHMVTPLPGVTIAKPGFAMLAIPGVSVDVVDDAGHPVANGHSGYLVITRPWPSMLRGIWGDDERFVDTYWSRWPGIYFAGDGALKDLDGAIRLLGRVDDVMNVSGHRLSTAEIESALASHCKVAEAAVVGVADETTGQSIVAFVILRESAGDGGTDIVDELRRHVRQEIGAIAKPRQIFVVDELPKTRSGKIMRRLLQDLAEHREVGSTTTLTDVSVMDKIAEAIVQTSDEVG